MNYLNEPKERLIDEIARLRRKITKLEADCKQAMESRELYRTIVENTFDIIYRCSADATITYLSPQASSKGFPPEKVVGRNLMEFVHPDDVDRVLSDFQRTMQTGEEFPTLFRLVTPDRNIIYVEEIGKAIWDDGEVIGLTGVIRDVTKRRKMEEELSRYRSHLEDLVKERTAELWKANEELQREITDHKKVEAELQRSEVLFRTAMESLPFDFFVIDKNGRYAMQNSTCRERWGDIVGKRPEDMSANEEILALWESNNRKAFAGEIVEGEVSFKVKGKLGFYHNIISPIYDDSQIRGILGVNIDISDRKQTEEALRKSELKYRELVENINDVMFSTDENGVITYVSPGVVKMIGYKPSEIIGRTFTDFVHQDDLQNIVEAFRRHAPQDFRFVRKSGEIRWVRTYSRPVLDGENIVGTQGLATDITERKQVEEAYRVLIENSLQGIVVIQDFKIVFANPAIAKISGYTSEELMSLSIEELRATVYPADQALVWGRMQERLEGKPIPSHYELRIVRNGGEVRWVDAYSSRIEYRGKPAVQAALIDITDRKRAEDALKQSQEKLRAQYKGIPIPVYTWQKVGEDFALVDYNDAAMSITRGHAAKFIGAKASELYLYRPEILKELWRCFHEKTAIEQDTFYKSSFTGETRYLAIRYAFVPPDLVLSHTEDITERKRIEEERKQMAEELRKHRDHLADLIEDRTIELRAINKKLQQEITERKRAQSQLRSLASEQSLIEEQERRRIATDLHDRISQTLAICKIKLGLLREASSSFDSDLQIEEIRELVDQTIQSTRSLTFELGSPILYELGLEAAVDSLAEQLQEEHGIISSLKDDDRCKPLGDDVRIVLFQAVRELLVNVVKHAQARNLRITIRKHKTNIRISVRDDGVGFIISEIIPNLYRTNAFGLFNIRERLEHLGGHLKVVSKPGSGTLVTLVAPLKLEMEVVKGE